MKRNKILPTIMTSVTALSAAAPLATSCHKAVEITYTISCSSSTSEGDLRKISKFEFNLSIDNKLPDNFTIFAQAPALTGAVKISKCQVTLNDDRTSAKLEINTATEISQLSPGLKTDFAIDFHILNNDKIISSQTISNFVITHKPQSPGSDNVELTSSKDAITAYAEKTANFAFHVKELHQGDEITAEIQYTSGSSVTKAAFTQISGTQNWILDTSIEPTDPCAEAKGVFQVIINCNGSDTWTATFDNLSVTYTPASKTIPESCLDIQDGVLNGIKSGKETIASHSNTLSIPNSVTSIKDGAFKDKIKSDGQYSFIKSLNIPSDTKLQTIGASAFENCSNINEALFIPSSVTTIGDSAFKGTLVTSLIIAETSTNGNLEIGKNAFQGVTTLSGSLVIPERVSVISESAFDGCTGLFGTLTIKSSTTILKDKAFGGCVNVETLDLSEFKQAPTNWQKYEAGVTSGAFAGWGLRGDIGYQISVIFNETISSETITAISNAFTQTSNGTITIKTNWATSASDFNYDNDGEDGLILTGVKNTLGSSVVTLLIPQYGKKDGETSAKPVTKIADNAFYDTATGTTKLSSNIKQLYFSKDSQVKSIGQNAFRNAQFAEQYKVGSLTIPNTVTNIGNYAFADAGIKSDITNSKLVEIKLSSSLGEIGEFAFATTTDVVANKNELYIGDNFLPNNIQTVKDSAFLNCIPNTKTFVFPNKLQNVDSEAFHFDWTNKLDDSYTFDFSNYEKSPINWTAARSRFIFIDAASAANLKGTILLPKKENDWDQYRSNQTYVTVATNCGFYNTTEANFKASPSMLNPCIFAYSNLCVTSFAFDGEGWMIEPDEIKKFITPGQLTFPAEVGGEEVQGIGANAFDADIQKGGYNNYSLKNDLGITKIIFPKNITFIGDYAFNNSGINDMDFTASDASDFTILLRSGEEMFTGLPTSGTIHLHLPRYDEYDKVVQIFKEWPCLANWTYKNE